MFFIFPTELYQEILDREKVVK